MTEPHTLTIPASLSDMLPAGMLVNGGIAAEAMATLANRKHVTPGWEAFHYERISESQFEITGGMAVTVGGLKKWPGLHDTVTLNEADIIAEMQRGQTLNTPLSITEKPLQQLDTPSSAKPQYLSVVFALPEDEAGRQRLLKAFHLQADFFGAKVQACSLQD